MKLSKWICISALAATAFLAACSNNEGVVACEATTKEIMGALDKLGKSPATDMIRKQFEDAKAQWADVKDQKALAQACHQVSDSMTAAIKAIAK